ncbi:MAG: enolase C-terminal domain-like protein [Verrucomicrobiota bacterium]|nr:enolase C-terminal domain-like protein [Verrucomicrobiota bacterium]
MAKPTDIQITATKLFFLPIETRVPLKFGTETLTHVTCARVQLTVCLSNGDKAKGWGETPLSVQWVWPSKYSYEARHKALKDFCISLSKAWAEFDSVGHPLEISHDFQQNELSKLLNDFNNTQSVGEPMPWLAALVCCSLFDIALHDAFGIALDLPTYETYSAKHISRDLEYFLEPAIKSNISFTDKFPNEFLVKTPQTSMQAWHLVGGLDLLEEHELTGDEPDDGHPVLLSDWIQTDGLTCLKIKLRGNDANWDYNRLIKVGDIAIKNGAHWLSADFNCTVNDPKYVNEILDRLMMDKPRIFGMILYVEQPFPYELESNSIDVHSVSARKPLFLDESAHNWQLVRLGRELGWTGVALKTCKTQTGAILSACWAKAHGMTLMVQDLTNPMLAQIPHMHLAAQTGTIMGIETNSMQFYPAASTKEEKIHSGIYKRRNGKVNIKSLDGPGFGYRVEEIKRTLPEPIMVSGNT